jgi:hypothetical protein
MSATIEEFNQHVEELEVIRAKCTALDGEAAGMFERLSDLAVERFSLAEQGANLFRRLEGNGQELKARGMPVDVPPVFGESVIGLEFRSPTQYIVEFFTRFFERRIVHGAPSDLESLASDLK